MKTYLTYGTYCAVASAALNLVLYFSGLQTDKMALGQYVQWLGIVFFAVVLFFGMKDVRSAKPNQEICYSGAFVAGLLISVFAGLFGAIYTYIHFTFVNPDFPQYLNDFTRAQLEAKGVPSANIEAALNMQTLFVKPWIQAVIAVFVTPIMGVLVSLILAIFVKRTPKAEVVSDSVK